MTYLLALPSLLYLVCAVGLSTTTATMITIMALAKAARTTLLGARAAVFLLPWGAHLFVADVLLSGLLPLSAVAPTLAYNVSSKIAASVWYGIQVILTRINGAKIIISGADPPRGESAIVVSNHGAYCVRLGALHHVAMI